MTKNIILETIIKESEEFLENHMSLKALSIESIEHNIPYCYTSLIELKGSVEFIIIMNIEKDLLTTLFDIFLPQGVAENEKEELMNALPEDIINTVIGLTLRHFPKQYDDLVLGIPFKKSDVEILEILENNVHDNLKVTTKKGSFICTVVRISE